MLKPLCLLVLVAIPSVAQTHNDCEEKIHRLEDRIVILERAVLQLTAQSPAPAVSNLSLPEAPHTTAAAPPRKFEMPPELIPEVGKIGAQVGLLIGGSSNPFKLDKGSFFGGFIDLPLYDKPNWIHGKISYEISIGIARSNTTFPVTSNVAQVANLAVLNALNPNGGLSNVSQAVTGTGSAPFPVMVPTETRFRMLEVDPFSLRYTTTVLDRLRLRPYALLGFGAFVTIHDQNPLQSTGVRQDANISPAVLSIVNQLFNGKAPFGGPLVAGQISQSAELEARGLPGGHGNFDIGLHTGAGVEFRVSRSLSLGFDARYNKISGSNGNFVTYGSRIGLHF